MPARGRLSVLAPTVLDMETTGCQTLSPREARAAVRASRRRRAGAGLWPRLSAFLMGAPSGAGFVVSVPEVWSPRVTEAAAGLGYDATEIHSSGGHATLDLVWTGTGYAPLSSRHRRDLVQGLLLAGVEGLAVIGPRAGVTPLREWWVVAEDGDHGPRLAAWLEQQGYAGGTVRAPTEHAARRIVGVAWQPPVPWRLEWDQEAPQGRLRNGKILDWLRGKLWQVVLVLAVLAGGAIAWFLGWGVRPAIGNAAVPSGDPFTIYVREVLLVTALQALIILTVLMPLRVPIVVGAGMVNRESRRQRIADVIGWTLMPVVGMAMGFFAVVLVRHQFLSVLSCSAFVAIVGFIGRLLDPPDRRRVRWPAAVAATLLASVVGWAALADWILAIGLGVPPGVVRADLLTRTAVLVVIFVPPAVVLLIGGWVYRLVRRQDRVASTGLVFMSLGTSAVIALAGFSFVLAEAGRIVSHPGQGFWGLSMSLHRISGLTTSQGADAVNLRNGELYGVVGELGDRAVLLTYPCGGGERRLVVHATQALTFEPIESRLCDAKLRGDEYSHPSP